MDMAAARLEASFLAPDLHGASGEILHNSGDEENERKSLLHQTQAYDQMLMDMETNMHKSSYSSETQCDCGSVEYKQALDLHPPNAPIIRSRGEYPPQNSVHTLKGGFSSFDGGLNFIGEDDGDDLLCDFAPNALQEDGSVGLIADDGSLVKPSFSQTSHWNMCQTSPAGHQRTSTLSCARFAASQQFQGFAKIGYDGVEEPCLSDSWHSKNQPVAQVHPAGPADSSDSSITALRQRYHKVFGKETSSNNRQWLLRRLAEINTFGEVDNCEERKKLHGQDILVATAKLSRVSAIETSEYVRVTHGLKLARKEQEKYLKLVETNTVEHSARQAKSMWKGTNIHKRGRGDNESHSLGGGLAKTDGSSAGKRIKKGNNSDSDSAGEPPVKSRNNSSASGNCKATQARKTLDTNIGGNGRRSKHHNPWALEEAEALVEGVAQCGGGKWADIKKLGFPAIEHRTAVDLKDKWRNLLRIAMLPHQPVKNAGDKKREIPPELLARVRELAAKHAKKQTQDGRNRHGR